MKPVKWESPPCPICQTAKYLRVLYSDVTSWEHPGLFTFKACSHCGMVLQSPRAPFSQVGQYYPAERYWGWGLLESGQSAEARLQPDTRYKDIYAEVFARFPRPGAILDVGTGTGLLLTRFRDRGWQVLGTELSRPAAAYVKKTQHIPVAVGELVSLHLPAKSYDVVVLNAVLEHVYNPLETLAECRRILKDNGLVVIVVPNIASLGHSVFGKEWYLLLPGNHLYHFSRATIGKILLKSGLTIDKFVGSSWVHDHYSIFNNIRYYFSPKFAKAPAGGLAQGTVAGLSQPTPRSVVKELGKLVAQIVAGGGALVETLLGRGEIMVVYAKKTSRN